uniref:Uncharacterized protein n=1 Tax=Panagrellus redivivus TaxID=6233 RepID=A0A7E4UW16_PANRE
MCTVGSNVTTTVAEVHVGRDAEKEPAGPSAARRLRLDLPSSLGVAAKPEISSLQQPLAAAVPTRCWLRPTIQPAPNMIKLRSFIIGTRWPPLYLTHLKSLWTSDAGAADGAASNVASDLAYSRPIP